MKKLMPVYLILFILLTSCSNQGSSILPYDSEEPITTPITFGEGVISTEDEPEWAFTFTPDGKKMYIQRGGVSFDTLYESEYIDDKWTEPVLFTFPSPDNFNLNRVFEPFISPDGNKFFFVSEGEGMGATDLWVSENKDGEWDKPTLLDIVNSPRNELLPSVSKKGNLYFQTNRNGSIRGFDIYVSKFVDGKYTEPERLGEEINTTSVEESPFIAPDESYLIFRRDAAFYISYNVDGSWSEGVLLPGEPLRGSFGTRYSPYVSPDQKYFFYSDGENIHQVDVSAMGLEIN
ncbi:TolB family protein [Chengkuizengella axinellae]|uniref:Uncharacterized protein n=1 Tax=Chengkuizengella axinellae TaxID=3064388 RepID=A0ABT9IZ17_9BACL|nr:hypothetical protein [Chengkuizengella sp. 2205SS18-9]MDP5274611.1 hypothetical protein [Chengkuizengella sp. 2205SS18-9]